MILFFKYNLKIENYKENHNELTPEWHVEVPFEILTQETNFRLFQVQVLFYFFNPTLRSLQV